MTAMEWNKFPVEIKLSQSDCCFNQACDVANGCQMLIRLSFYVVLRSIYLDVYVFVFILVYTRYP